jgi:hypothetical protein
LLFDILAIDHGSPQGLGHLGCQIRPDSLAERAANKWGSKPLKQPFKFRL